MLVCSHVVVALFDLVATMALRDSTIPEEQVQIQSELIAQDDKTLTEDERLEKKRKLIKD